MKRCKIYILTPLFLLYSLLSTAQPDDEKYFKMKGSVSYTIPVNQLPDNGRELFLFEKVTSPLSGLSVSGKIDFTDDDGLVRIILVDKQRQEHLVYEMYSLMAGGPGVTFTRLCEETALLEGILPGYLKIELNNAILRLDEMHVSEDFPPGIRIQAIKKEIREAQNNAKIVRLNRNLKEKGHLWRAGHTEVSAMSYAERKLLYGQSKFPAGMEFYTGGILQGGQKLKAATASLMVEKWDWRTRHGKMWISPVKNQGGCGSCWAFAATGATEAQVNLYFNQLLNLNLSEQDVLSCSGAGTCQGGYPGTALSYISATGIVDEAAFIYTATDQPCTNKSANPFQLIKIAGKVDFGTTTWPREEDALKKMIIKYGPLSGGIYDWSHAIVLVGWQVVKEGDIFYTRDLNKATGWITVPAGSPLIGTTVWIFKNSWGSGWGDAGYVYVQTTMANVGWTHALLNPVQSLKQSYAVNWGDSDGDGYYWWGLGSKPTACPGPETPDGDDSNPALGPLDQYGNCILLGGAPTANFSADQTTLNAGGVVNFTDLSTNAPTSWSWTFEGGVPATSATKNPAVTYPEAGTFNVTLTVSNANGSSTKTMTDYITVNAIIPFYCASNGTASREWISMVSLNGVTSSSGSSGISGYQDFTADGLRQFDVNKGSGYTMTLAPAYSSKTSNAEYFSVWIDFNQDFDFLDAGEQVCTAAKVKLAVSRNIVIPSTAVQGTTRMRVSMKRNALPVPCEVFSNGEVEDYSVTIGPPAVKSAGLAETALSRAGIRFYPNPADKELILELEQTFDGDRCSLFTVHGIQIGTKKISGRSVKLDVSGLPPGVYLLEVFNGNSRVTEKFIKK